MPSKSVVVGSAIGLHARPAAIIAEKAGELGSDVTINGVDASSSLMIMTLGAKNGGTVEVESDDQAALDTIAALVSRTSTRRRASRTPYAGSGQWWRLRWAAPRHLRHDPSGSQLRDVPGVVPVDEQRPRPGGAVRPSQDVPQPLAWTPCPPHRRQQVDGVAR